MAFNFEGLSRDVSSESQSDFNFAGLDTQDEENEFQSWYKGVAARTGLNPDPDDPKHFYDYRAAHIAGAEPGADGH